MARPLVSVRPATPDDLPELLAMWREHRDLGVRYERVVPEPSEDAVLAALRSCQCQEHARFVVATIGDEVVGMAVLTTEPFAALFDAPTVHLNYLHVRAGHRRRGVGHALVAAAAAHAEDVGAEHVVTGVHPRLREAQRFYAQLGFGPMVVRRVAPVSVLRRRVGLDRSAQGADVLARRRSLRSRVRVRESLARLSPEI